MDFHAIAASGDNVYVVWEDLGPDGFVVYVTSSTDRGLTFTQPDNISLTGASSGNSQIKLG